MCGIAGFFESPGRRGQDDCVEIGRRMTSTLAHRGPDDEGVWADAEAGVVLGHRRLAILDLSPGGHQPMHCADSRYVIVFNGEIYNFLELRVELESRGHVFRGRSDTEVMLAAISQWGILASVARFVGMFAFALWDRHASRLYLARDRAGEKPLYYGWLDSGLVFGSELKALRAHPEWRGDIDRNAVALVVRHGYIPSPRCIFRGIYKLPPGCALALSATEVRNRQDAIPSPYWLAQCVAEAGQARPFAGSEAEAAERLLTLLNRAVAQQMIADVPVGAFLSGGIDSSLVAATMQAQSSRPVKTFSIGFEDKSLDEAPLARAVARYLGTEHTEYYVGDDALLRVVPALPSIYDEPFADPSQIPTTILCRLARDQVKVSLSGDGGDELFGGYTRYAEALRLWELISRVPERVRRLARHARTLARVGASLRVLPGSACRAMNRLSCFSDVLSAGSDRALYRQLMSPNRDYYLWLQDGVDAATPSRRPTAWDRLPELLQRMLWQDLVSYLPDDILVKVDRAAMAVGMETRVPLLDHRIIEFAWSLPSALKRQRNHGKWLLRKALFEMVPPELVDRPKRGFGAPIAAWLRGPLREWAEDLLAPGRLRREGFLQPGMVRTKWEEHVSARCDWSAGLWHVLMFEAWLDHQEAGIHRAEPAHSIATEPQPTIQA